MQSCREGRLLSLPKCGPIESHPEKKDFEIFLDNGTRARIDFLEGLTTQQSFVALGRALDERLGPCSIIAMNDLALFDESDGLSEEQKRKLFKALGNPLNSASASNTISRVSVG
jgi:hypothetical protein